MQKKDLGDLLISTYLQHRHKTLAHCKFRWFFCNSESSSGFFSIGVSSLMAWAVVCHDSMTLLPIKKVDSLIASTDPFVSSFLPFSVFSPDFPTSANEGKLERKNDWNVIVFFCRLFLVCSFLLQLLYIHESHGILPSGFIDTENCIELFKVRECLIFELGYIFTALQNRE